MGYFTAVLDPDPTSPAGLVAHYHIEADYLGEPGLAQLMQRCSAITTEFENVPATALYTLGAHRPVAPSAESVAVCQDRGVEKQHFIGSGVPCAPFALIESAAQLDAVPATLLPGILKTARLGYDGKGQVQRRPTALRWRAAWDELQRVPCVLEQRLALALEISVIVARAADGTCVHLPVQQNLHRDGILAVTQVPAPDVAAARAAAGDRRSDGDWPRRCATSACSASSSSSSKTARWWPTRWRRGRTTPATTASMPATCRSSSCRCAAWPACRWRRRACIRRR